MSPVGAVPNRAYEGSPEAAFFISQKKCVFAKFAQGMETEKEILFS